MVQTKFAKTEDMSNGYVKVLLLIQENFTFNQSNVPSDILSEKNE